MTRGCLALKCYMKRECSGFGGLIYFSVNLSIVNISNGYPGTREIGDGYSP